MSNSLKAGDIAPDFKLKDQSGKEFHLQKALGKGHLVIYFYHRDTTSGCVAQASAFRDHYQDFKDAGAEVIGISSEPEEKHMFFIGKHSLPFKLLSDPKGVVRALFRVPKTLGIIPGRVTYVLDRDGTVKYIFNSQTKIKDHITKTLEIIKEL
jgi:thioredoxin-dependent peroxiredoxin